MGNANSDLTPASEQGKSTSEKQQQRITPSLSGNLTENARNSNRSPDTSAGTTASAMVTGQDPQPATAQDAGTSGQNQQPSTLSPAGNLTENATNHNRSPDTYAGTTAPAMATATDQDPQPVPTQEAGTSAEGQPPDTVNPTEFACPICLGTAFRQDQLKRMRCNHVFHQSCLDVWLNNNRSCPICRTPYRKLPRKRKTHAGKGLRATSKRLR